VTSPKITALPRHSAHIIADGKVIKMEHLNESQLRAQAVRLIEENHSYGVIARKPCHSKAWVSTWAKRWKTNVEESLQSQQKQLTNRTALNLSANIMQKLDKN